MGTNEITIIARFLRPFRGRVAGLIVLTAILSILAMLPPLLVRAVIDRVIAGGERSLFSLLGFFMLMVPAISAACSYVQTLGTAFVGQRFVMGVRSALYEHLLKLSMGFYGKYSIGKLVNRVMGDTGFLSHILTVGTVQIVSDLVCAAFAILATFALNWRLATVLVLFVLLFVLNYKAGIKRIMQVTRRHRDAEDRVAGGVQNRLLANLTVKVFGTEGREHGLFQAQSERSLELIEESQHASTAMGMNTSLLQDIGRIIIYFLGCAMVLRGGASYGDVIAFTTYAMQLLGPAVRFSFMVQQIQDVRISLERISELMDETPEITSKPAAVRIGRTRGGVDFDDVTFGYSDGRPVLRSFDLHVRPGERIALIGPTGCGKTTVLSLLLRFFDVQKGAVRVDGMDVRDIQLGSLRRQFGVVLQEPHLFGVSLADNIRYSRPAATAEEVKQAAGVAEIHDFITRLPNGYESEVGRRNVQLSVGQKQRVSIARAVLANPPIIIMDEATSSLDSDSERAIQAAMERFLVGRTSFVVAHRLSTIRNADRIVLMEGGEIQEMGRHEELMAIPKGRYRELYMAHAGSGVIGEDWKTSSAH